MHPLASRISVAVSLFFWCQQVVGQAPRPAPDPVAASIALLHQQYTAAAVDYPQLFNGTEYVDYAKRYYKSIGHQFFLSPEGQAGSASYNGHYFPDLTLYYDAVLDQVVLRQEPNPFTVTLVSEYVREFTLADHRFIRLVADSLTGPAVRTGYYEVLVDSDTQAQLLAKRAKRQQERIVDSKVNIEFIEAERLFIRKAGQYHPVSSKGSVTSLFSDRGKQVQSYIRTNKLKFKKATRETAITQLTRYYNSLGAGAQ